MGSGVVGEREMQDVLKIFGDDAEPPAMREPIGVQRQQHARGDTEEAKTAPCRKQRQKILQRRRPVPGLRADQGVDDPPEQHRLRELRGRERDIGKRKHHAQPPFGAEHRENAGIEAKERHAVPQL